MRHKSVDNLTVKKQAHSALSAGGFRVSAEATEMLSKLALHNGDKAVAVARNARKIASLNGRKTVLKRDIESATLAC